MSTDRELTFRSLFSGVVLGALLTPSNIYSGLKIGWSFNMSIIALLVSYGLWRSLQRWRLGTAWSMRESNINQTTASAAASIISGGLVAPIPAYTLLTGERLDAAALMAWVFSVSFLGIWVAWYLRRSMVEDTRLRFPEAVATLETMQQVYSHGRDALQRLYVLGAAALLGGLIKWADTFVFSLPRWTPTATLERLTFNLDPSPLLIGFGGIIGIRVGLSLLLGALLAWGGLAPWLLASGLVQLDAAASGPQFGVLVEWLLWPGVALLVSATLTALAVRYRRSRNITRTGAGAGFQAPAKLPLAMLGLSSLLVIILQVLMFDIDPLMALLSIPLALVLACMAARVVGATGIPPIGATGQLSQLTFGLIAPGQIGINLMSANTAGGAAGQCTDLLNDFRVGHAIGARPYHQLIAQCLGIVTGSIVGVLVYQILIPDPQAMLISAQWPAPAVATWKAVAEVLGYGIDSLDSSIRWAMLVGGLVGAAFGVLEATLPPQSAFARLLPSSAAFGLAFIIPASISLMMTLGALLAWVLQSRWRSLGERFGIAAAAGLVAGESIVGVGASFWMMFAGG
ncbi:OPT/YSL family transporter [Phytopseudomonas dryadis]|uniref:Peptide transporter n=1 Tax=Phytopseudomonas dryadis TaxID=2487520 RepID=A0ABY1Z1N7_9GAMM|nr:MULTISPECIES: OPT family oligopeptide transporter [Pseudomonas]TBV00704.1 peptide transporter [Pseudomonas dryadis]TBV13178.1 peptide transporter [Pseudomonas sp. FRB 230]